ncbi:MAG: hypothetical protein JO264_19530 [Acidisphaera sp.]|nr:hypothetical protein [Acidisphaera sp.]
MDDEDRFPPEVSAEGIMQCLCMLAEEAASLRLLRTLLALRAALETCQSEIAAGELLAPAEAAETAFPAGMTLH